MHPSKASGTKYTYWTKNVSIFTICIRNPCVRHASASLSLLPLLLLFLSFRRGPPPPPFALEPFAPDGGARPRLQPKKMGLRVFVHWTRF